MKVHLTKVIPELPKEGRLYVIPGYRYPSPEDFVNECWGIFNTDEEDVFADWNYFLSVLDDDTREEEDNVTIWITGYDWFMKDNLAEKEAFMQGFYKVMQNWIDYDNCKHVDIVCIVNPIHEGFLFSYNVQLNKYMCNGWGIAALIEKVDENYCFLTGMKNCDTHEVTRYVHNLLGERIWNMEMSEIKQVVDKNKIPNLVYGDYWLGTQLLDIVRMELLNGNYREDIYMLYQKSFCSDIVSII